MSSLGCSLDRGPESASVWHYGSPAMLPRSLVETHLALIERAIRRVCRDARIEGEDANDFDSSVKLALLANDGAILQKHEGRASLATYITVVIRRLLVDQLRTEGRWYASAEAKRRGDAAILLDRLLHRDHRPFEEAAVIVTSRHPQVSAAQLRVIAASLPQRAARPRLVGLGEHDDERFASQASADDRLLEHDLEERSAFTSRVVSGALAAMTPEDRVVLRLRYGKGASIADIARALGVAQRPLYRRVEALLAQLRDTLQHAGLDAASVTDLIGGTGPELEFGLNRSSGVHPATAVARNGDGAQEKS